MAQIEMRITAVDAEDLQKTLKLLAGASPLALSGALNVADPSTTSASVTDASTASAEATPGLIESSEPSKRTRRTKEQIAADEAAAKAAATPADPFAEQVREAIAGPSYDDVYALGKAYMAQTDGKTVIDLIKAHSTTGAESFKTIDPNDYPAVYEALQAVVKV